MSKVKKYLKWTGGALISLLLLGAIYLAIIGVPKPPDLRAENVPRIPFSQLSEIKKDSEDLNNPIQLLSWSNTAKKLFVSAYDGLDIKIAVLDSAGAPPRFMDDWPKNIRPIFNPNPQKNYFLYRKDNSAGQGNQQIYRFNMQTAQSEMLSNGEHWHGSVRFTPDGSHIIYSSVRRNNVDADIYIMDPEEPDSERLIYENNRIYFNGGYPYIDSFSPKGDRLIIRNGQTETDPFILNLKTGEVTELKDDPLASGKFYYHQWSVDGQKIFYPTSYNSNFTRLRVKDLTTGIDSLLIGNLNWNISNVNQSPDGKWLVFNVNEDGNSSLYIHNLKTGKSKRFNKLPRGSITFTTFHAGENNTMAFPLVLPSGSTSIYSYNIEKDILKAWMLPDKTKSLFPDPKTIQYPTFDIDTITGKRRQISLYYHRPGQNFKTPHPVIISIHNGPETQARPQRDQQIEFYLKKGYALLVPNVRGTSGYGKAFRELDDGMLREHAVKDIGALLDWISTQPELDKSRVIVRGEGYGGYMTLSAATLYSDRLAGAISYSGFSDLVSLQEYTGKKTDRSLEYGDINDPHTWDFLKRIAPVNNAAKIDVPVLMVHGAKNPYVPVSESRAMVAALKKEGKEYWYIEGENVARNPNELWIIAYTLCADKVFIERVFNTE